jgi:hypothetical protein
MTKPSNGNIIQGDLKEAFSVHRSGSLSICIDHEHYCILYILSGIVYLRCEASISASLSSQLHNLLID